MGKIIERVVTEDMALAAVAASNNGVGIKAICTAFGCGKSVLQSAMKMIGHTGKYTGPVMGVPAARKAARTHWPKLRAAMAGRPIPAVETAPVVQRAAYRRVSDDLGIRAYVRPDGISVPYVPSIHDGGRV